jgi:hypothetical protein
MLQRLTSSDQVVREEALKEVTEDRAALIEGLMAVLEEGKASNEVKADCLRLLGRLRAKEAANLIAFQYLLFTLPRRQPSVEERLEDTVPGMTALREIGLPAVPALVSNIRLNPDQEVQKRSVHALYGIVGKYGKWWLLDSLEKEENAEVRERLQAAVQFFEKQAKAK